MVLHRERESNPHLLEQAAGLQARQRLSLPVCPSHAATVSPTVRGLTGQVLTATRHNLPTSPAREAQHPQPCGRYKHTAFELRHVFICSLVEDVTGAMSSHPTDF